MFSPRNKEFEKYYICQVSVESKTEYIEQYLKTNKSDWNVN